MKKDERDKESTEPGKPAPLDPERLIDAADAIIAALDEYKIDTRGGTIAPIELLGAPNQPKVLCDYTRWEIEQASAFMTRLGLIEPVRARKA
jgi:hypothetical protein